MLHGERWITLRLLHGRYHDRFKEMRYLKPIAMYAEVN
jgi:hypothetical protein